MTYNKQCASPVTSCLFPLRLAQFCQACAAAGNAVPGRAGRGRRLSTCNQLDRQCAPSCLTWVSLLLGYLPESARDRTTFKAVSHQTRKRVKLLCVERFNDCFLRQTEVTELAKAAEMVLHTYLDNSPASSKLPGGETGFTTHLLLQPASALQVVTGPGVRGFVRVACPNQAAALHSHCV